MPLLQQDLVKAQVGQLGAQAGQIGLGVLLGGAEPAKAQRVPPVVVPPAQGQLVPGVGGAVVLEAAHPGHGVHLPLVPRLQGGVHLLRAAHLRPLGGVLLRPPGQLAARSLHRQDQGVRPGLLQLGGGRSADHVLHRQLQRVLREPDRIRLRLSGAGVHHHAHVGQGGGAAGVLLPAEHLQKGGQLQLGTLVGIDNITLGKVESSQHKDHHHRQSDRDKLQNIRNGPAAPIAAYISVGPAHDSPPNAEAFVSALLYQVFAHFTTANPGPNS